MIVASIMRMMQGTYTPTSPAKKDINQKDLKDSLADGLGDDDEESLDWWTKYFASVDLMIKVGQVQRKSPKQEGWSKCKFQRKSPLKSATIRRGWPTGLRVWWSSQWWRPMWPGGKVVR